MSTPTSENTKVHRLVVVLQDEGNKQCSVRSRVHNNFRKGLKVSQTIKTDCQAKIKVQEQRNCTVAYETRAKLRFT